METGIEGSFSVAPVVVAGEGVAVEDFGAVSFPQEQIKIDKRNIKRKCSFKILLI